MNKKKVSKNIIISFKIIILPSNSDYIF